tara:strand:- start:741 stop:929 length:189 start_codon:yes stop_codon:yes gene_type:complete
LCPKIFFVLTNANAAGKLFEALEKLVAPLISALCATGGSWSSAPHTPEQGQARRSPPNRSHI